MQYWIPDNTGLRYCNFQSPCNQTPQRLKTSAFLNLPAAWARGGSKAEDENSRWWTCGVWKRWMPGLVWKTHSRILQPRGRQCRAASLNTWNRATNIVKLWLEWRDCGGISKRYLPQQIDSSISVGVLHWAESVGSFTPSRYRQTPTQSSPEAGPQVCPSCGVTIMYLFVALALEILLLLLQFGFHTVTTHFCLSGCASVTWQWDCLSALHS